MAFALISAAHHNRAGDKGAATAWGAEQKDNNHVLVSTPLLTWGMILPSHISNSVSGMNIRSK